MAGFLGWILGWMANRLLPPPAYFSTGPTVHDGIAGGAGLADGILHPVTDGAAIRGPIDHGRIVGAVVLLE